MNRQVYIRTQYVTESDELYIECGILSPHSTNPCHKLVGHGGSHEAYLPPEERARGTIWTAESTTPIRIFARKGVVVYELDPEAARLLAVKLPANDEGWAEDSKALLWAAHQAEGTP